MPRLENIRWRKSSYSGGNGGNCVEVGITVAGTVVGIRDSKRPEDGHLAVTPALLGALLADIKADRLDLA